MFAAPKCFAAILLLSLSFCGGTFADEPSATRVETIAVTIGGDFSKKGKIILPSGSTFMDAVYKAGITPFTNLPQMCLIRDGQLTRVDAEKLRKDGSQGPALHDGDNLQAPFGCF